MITTTRTVKITAENEAIADQILAERIDYEEKYNFTGYYQIEILKNFKYLSPENLKEIEKRFHSDEGLDQDDIDLLISELYWLKLKEEINNRL